ncbi:Hemin-binding lipoprotein [Serratia fonticola]|uniref:Hemin-binding lipoprotein n=1 Tax=Serratia fonticola TaxID=47917 RepID=A0A4U9WKB7_SERFO|nr:Hemin-binding lipoprotein [Serratia fonticola]
MRPSYGIWQPHYAPVLSAEYADNLTLDGTQEMIDREPVGTGPFLLNEYRSGQYIRLARNDVYWKGKPRMPQVVIDMGAGGTGRLSQIADRRVRRIGLPPLPASFRSCATIRVYA